MELETENIVAIIKNLKTQSDWVTEVNNLACLIEKLDKLNKVISVREIARLTNKSKTWVGVTMILIRGLRLYPEIEKLNSRNHAYEYLQRKQKLRRFVES